MRTVVAVLLVTLFGSSVAEARATCQTSTVVMFMATWCPYCNDAAAFFRRHNIYFETIDVERSLDPRMRQWNRYDGIPVIWAEGYVVRGFIEYQLRTILCVVN